MRKSRVVFFSSLRPLIREWLCKGTHFKVNLQVSSTNPAQRFLASHHYLNLFKFSHAVTINISRKFSRYKHSIYKQYETTLHAKLGLAYKNFTVSPFNGGVHHFHALKISWSISRSRRWISTSFNTKSTKTLVARINLRAKLIKLRWVRVKVKFNAS